ncbi:MAG UNVERIFIED_CONTAM: hypothetical protein LVR18_32600 [Planctomycetaceae bacterium]
MLRIVSQPDSGRGFCDGLSRRRMLQIGSLSTFGLTLPGLLRAEQGGFVHPAAAVEKVGDTGLDAWRSVAAGHV